MKNQTTLRDEWLDVIGAWAARHPIEGVWLFGSRARGDHRVDSDIDLAVMPSGDNLEERFQTWRAEWRDDLVIDGVTLDIEWYYPDDHASTIVGPAVRAEGIRIYAGANPES